MRPFLAVVALLGLVAGAAAGDDRGRRGWGQPDLDIWVPIDPYEHERMYWKRKSDRDLVPGGVSINGKPRYVCDLDDETFTDRERFAAHLRLEHAVPADRIRESLVDDDGVIHFAGE
jgi:hypothetical protein